MIMPKQGNPQGCGAQMDLQTIVMLARFPRTLDLSRSKVQRNKPCLPPAAKVASLVKDRRASIPDQVAMRIDVPAWLAAFFSTGTANRQRRCTRLFHWRRSLEAQVVGWTYFADAQKTGRVLASLPRGR